MGPRVLADPESMVVESTTASGCPYCQSRASHRAMECTESRRTFKRDQECVYAHFLKCAGDGARCAIVRFACPSGSRYSNHLGTLCRVHRQDLVVPKPKAFARGGTR